MSSVMAVERPSVLPSFPTTVGFHVQGGFDVPAQPASPCTPTLSFNLAKQKQFSSLAAAPADKGCGLKSGLLLQRQVADGPSFSSSFPGAAFLKQPNVAATASSGIVAAAPAGPSPVGWKGLLEFSENSGCSGVLGPAAALSDDLDNILNRDCKIEICCTAHTTAPVRRLVKSVIRGLRACQEPDKATDGMGGTYFFANDSGKKAAILKPCDEEPLAPNNPKGYVGRQLGDPGWKPTVRVGEAAIREVAAYLLDHEGWARVPTSVLVRARHPVFCYQASRQTGSASSGGNVPLQTQASGDGVTTASDCSTCVSPASAESLLPMKLGSLQEFVTHECDTSEMGPSRFSVRDVHRIGILDLRLFNTDRHAGNMLVRTPRMASSSTSDLKSRIVASDGMYELIPIDHGFCLPETLEAPYFEWLHWPQTMLPFSDEELEYIRSLSVEKDKDILRRELPILRPECLRVLEVCTTLLKEGAAASLTLFDIASVMTRPFVDSDEEPSELERMCAYARQCVEYTKELNQQCPEDDCESVSSAEFTEGPSKFDAASTAEDVAADGQRRMTRNMLSIREDMFFDWEDDGHSGRLGRHRHVDSAAEGRDGAEYSPESYSPGSSPPLSEHIDMQPVGSSSSSEGGAIGIVPRGGVVEGNIGQRGLQMASSVHVTEGFFRRKLQNQQAVNRATAAKGGVLTCPKRSRLAQHTYPPPVAAFSPERMSACFSDMSDEQWMQFMDVVKQQISTAIESGRWKQSVADLASGMAFSCPRF